MAVIRQLNILGQMRLDTPHLRSLESSIAADFDLLAGTIMAGQKALVVRGFDIDVSGMGQQAAALKMNVAGGILMHSLASEAGTIFAVNADTQPEELSPTNNSVSGSFITGQTNFIGINLIRQADASTTDTVMFLDANTRIETPRSIPLARTLSYSIVISTTDFSATPHVCPIAKVTLNSVGEVTTIVDCRPMAYRLGSGGSAPDALNTYPWAQGRTGDVQGEFTRGDKGIGSEKDWRDAVMTRLWELGGGERWYSPTSDRDVKLCFGKSTFATGKNFAWANDKLSWKGLSVAFANSAVSGNVIASNEQGLTLNDGDCLYVDINRASALVDLVPDTSPLSSLGTPTVPGSRFIIAWRRGNEVFARDYPIEVTRDLAGIPTHDGQDTALALFAGNEPGKLVWKRIEPFVAGNAGYVQYDNGEGLAGDANFFWNKDDKFLGIGTNAPETKLHIKAATGDAAITIEGDPSDSDDTAGPYILMKQDGGTTSSIIGHNPGYGTGDAGGEGPDGSGYTDTRKNALLVATTSSHFLQLGTDQKVALSIDTSQNVGIGVVDPAHPLHIQRATGKATIHVQADDGSAALVLQANKPDRSNDYLSGEVASPYILMKQDNETVQSIIGHNQSDSHDATEAVYTFAKNDAMLVGTKTNSFLQLGTNSTVAVWIDGSQRVGIGKAQPSVKLDVNGAIKASEYVESGSNVYAVGYLQSNLGTLYLGPDNLSWRLKSVFVNGFDHLEFSNNGYVAARLKTASATGASGGLYDIGASGMSQTADFTGQHRCLSNDVKVKDFDRSFVGMIVVATGKYTLSGSEVSAKDGVTINESLPTIVLSSKRNEKCCFGVISSAEDPESEVREYAIGNLVSSYPKAEDDNRIVVNSLGEGAIWVCDANGPLENGDYITTSEAPGHGMKQDDDLLHNYTVAKITMDCDFDPKNGEYEVVEFEHNGKKYKKAFVGCTYHCG